MSTRSNLVAAAAAVLLSAGAQAAAPVISGTFGSGVTAGTVSAESYDHFSYGGAENWTFWTFTADFVSDVSITVTPTGGDFDPIIAVWYGIETDTANYFDFNSSSVGTVFVAGADGTPGNMFAGPGEAASLSFLNIYGNGPFVLAIADWKDNTGVGQLGYTITASVPEPATWAQLALGLGLLGGLARSRAKRA